MPILLLGISSFRMKKMVSVVVARRRISFPNDLVHTSLYLGCFIRWQYSSRSPVSLSRTAYARSHRNWRGYFIDALCHAVKWGLVSWYLHALEHEVLLEGSRFSLLSHVG